MGTVDSWREGGLVRAKELEALAAWLASQAGTDSAEQSEPVRDAVQFHINAAGAELQTGSKLRQFWARSGASRERAVSNLDAAEALLLQIAPTSYVRGQLPQLLTRIQQLSLGDPRRVEVEQIVRRANDRGLTATDRSILASALQAAQMVDQRARLRIRSFRNIVAATTTILALLAILLAILGALAPNVLMVCFPLDGSLVCATGISAAGDGASAHRADIALVEIAGVAGAAIAASLSLRNLGSLMGPYRLPIWLALLKLPTGAIMAVLGLLLFRGEFLPGLGNLDTPAQVIAWAIVFGYAQQLSTRLVDAQAQRLIDRASDQVDLHAANNSHNHPALESAVTAALRSSLATPRPVNFNGALSVWLENEDGINVAADLDGLFQVNRGQQYQVVATVGPEPAPSALHVPVSIDDGDLADIVPFTISLVGGRASESHEQSLKLQGSNGTGTVRFSFVPDSGANGAVWVRLGQLGNLIQLVELDFAPAKSVESA